MKKGNLAKAMSLGLEKRGEISQKKKRERTLQRFLKTERGQQLVQRLESGELNADSIAVDGKNIEVKATIDPTVEDPEDPEDQKEMESLEGVYLPPKVCQRHTDDKGRLFDWFNEE